MYNLGELKIEVSAQAKRLDITHPGWRSRVRANVLFMDGDTFHPHHHIGGCVLAQIDYYYRQEKLSPDSIGSYEMFLVDNRDYEDSIAFYPTDDEAALLWTEDVTTFWISEIHSDQGESQCMS